MKFRFILVGLALLTLQAQAKTRNIKRVETIRVEQPQGTAPRLPWRVWVTYTDGTAEWRQTRWSNALAQTEREEAALPVGTQYTVQGYIIGDNTERQGYPIEAQVTVQNAASGIPNATSVEPLPLSSVRITGQNILTDHRDRDIKTLLAFDVTQQLYNYRDTYGQSTKGYTEADGWDSPTTKLKGHGTGHYLSALAMAYASAENAQDKAALFSRIERMVKEMRQMQELTFVWNDSLGRYWEARDYAPEEELKEMKGSWAAFNEYKKDYKKYGYGYMNAIPAAHCALIEKYAPYNNEEGVWAPYYTVHKQLAGLIDVANIVEDKQIANTALLIAKDMGLWVWNRLHYRTYVDSEGTPELRRQRPGNRYEMWNMYIAGEVGGMEESLARLSEMVSDKTEKARLLEAASYFDAPAFFQPLSRNIDDIRTRHANQHIPMITGALRSYRGNQNPFYYNLARNFWDLVQGRYAYSTGGVGNGEMFRQPYTQMISMTTHPNADINETCCAYNLAKLTKDLNCYTPDDAALMDYYERVLYNQIIGSLHPTEWACTYQYAVGLNGQKPYGNETPQSTCCGGTGVENHVKYQEAAYFQNDTCLWVSLYLPTEVQTPELSLTQECTWPAEQTSITFHRSARPMAVKLRVPYWATQGFRVRLNGKLLCQRPQPSSYFLIPSRQWQEGDRIDIEMPFTIHVSFGPDKMEIATTEDGGRRSFPAEWLGTLMCGPLAMATADAPTWEQTEVTLKSDLSDVQRVDRQGLVGLTAAGKQFLPDYSFSTPSTRYLRLHVANGKKSRHAALDYSLLEAALQMAQERQAQPEAWAPHGMKRMQKALENAQQGRTLKVQRDIDALTSELNMQLTGMRPATLAELEDLEPLQQLLRERTNAPQEARRYAEMVIRYVRDGSGTHDMIEKAVKGLK